MIGKTIARVEELRCGKALIFTDGTAVTLHPLGYEADDVGFEECSEMDIIHAQALEENRARTHRASAALLNARYREGKMGGLELAIYEECIGITNQLRKEYNLHSFGRKFTIPIERHA